MLWYNEKLTTTTQDELSKQADKLNNHRSSSTHHVPKSSETEALFITLSSAYWGKQYYFKEPNGLWYSRYSATYLSFQDAVAEFTRKLSED
mgnify:CR=1 FL=1